MIITEATSSPVITNIPATPSRFKIKASAKAFKILSGFYSEPILAIPRELGANAWDSHVAAGNTSRMFEVHAPNQLEPWFSVRDFGTGLTPEAIDQIYTTYFESTKTGENDSDGCMGLGSKTPFNYTDNFNVTSWRDGKKHVYNCFIDAEGSPNIMHVATEDSTGHNGLEVKFGVKISEISMWVDKITRAYSPFRNRPIIVGANIQYPAREYLYQGKGWGYRKEEGYHARNGTNAFMGNYCYPVTVSALRSALHEHDDAYQLEQALNYGRFDFFFNIGDLEVAPNKEQLQYEDKNATTLAIVAALRAAIGELKEMVLKNVEVPKTRWEAMKLFTKYNNYNSEYAQLRNIIGDIPIKFNGDKITVSGESVVSIHSKLKIIDGQTPIAHPYQVYFLDTLYGKLKKTANYSSTHSRPVVMFYTNGETVKVARLRYHLVTKYGQGAIPACYIITDASPKAKNFHAHKDHFGWDADGISILEIESLPKPPPAARVKKTATTDEIFYTTLSSATGRSHGRKGEVCVGWAKKAEVIDATKTYYYMDFLWYDPAYNGSNISSDMVNSIVKVFAEAKLNKGEDIIYGINAKNKNLLKVGTWVNVAEVVKKYVAKHKDKFEQAMYLHRTYGNELREFSNLHRQLTRNGTVFLSALTNADTKALFKNFADGYAKFTENGEMDYADSFYSTFGITAKKHEEPPVNTAALKKVVTTKYMGIFDIIEDVYYNNHTAKVANIINFIDANS